MRALEVKIVGKVRLVLSLISDFDFHKVINYRTKYVSMLSAKAYELIPSFSLDLLRKPFFDVEQERL